MSGTTQKAAAWVYQGLWGILAGWFRVPGEPPTLPFHDAAAVESFRPSEAYLRYLKLLFWVVLTLLDGAVVVAWVALLIAVPLAGAMLALPLLAIVILPDIIAYIAIHLRYDTTWYVLTDRSMRIRRGIWTIRETTITFENIQNVTVRQGPLQRIYGISNVIVQTAGGGSARGPHGEEILGPHAGVLEGLADAARIRDLTLSRLKQSKTAGLGDEGHRGEVGGAATGRTWTPEHIAVLREIRDRARALAAARGAADHSLGNEDGTKARRESQ